jgi:hypothetical protein
MADQVHPIPKQDSFSKVYHLSVTAPLKKIKVKIFEPTLFSRRFSSKKTFSPFFGEKIINLLNQSINQSTA